MNSALGIVAALLIFVAVVAMEVKRSIDVAEHWKSGDHEWGRK